MSNRAHLYHYASGTFHQNKPVTDIFQQIHDSSAPRAVTQLVTSCTLKGKSL